ncbi:MAG TPA: choice-of-anchor D domain-containing protein [Kofleriaceae bacterium]|nr:choice-of-anchor D domain-containing protein [Kofleriaceae bacterium]
MSPSPGGSWATCSGSHHSMSKRWLGLLLLGVWIGAGGVAHAAATITPSADPLDFGPVVVGQTPTLTDTLTTDMPVAKVTVTLHGGGGCGDFMILSPIGEFNIDPSPSDGQPVMVKFSPSLPMDRSCVVDIKVNGTLSRSFNLSGTGKAPAIHIDQFPTFSATEVGKSSTAQLKLSNPGSSPLTITDATLSPNSEFSVSGLPTAPLAVGDPPVTLTITCTPTTFGNRTDTLGIVSDAFQDSPHNISLSCTGTEGVLALDQTTALAFGTVPRGGTQTKTFKLSNTGNVDVANVTLAVTANLGYSLDITSIATLSPGPANAVMVTASFKPMSKTDGGTATITITGSWGTTPTMIQLPPLDLTGTEASFGLMPAQPMLDFGKFRYDTHPKQTATGAPANFQLLNDGKATLMMTALFVPDDGTKAGEYQVVFANGNLPVGATAMLAENDQVSVEVTPQVQHRIGVVSGRIDITPDVGVPLHVPVTGIATAAEIDAPATVDFGVVDLSGPPVTQTIMITNNGDGALDIQSITATDPSSGGPPSAAFSFALPGTLPRLERGASLAIPVTYQPTVATGDSPDAVLLTAQLGGSLDADLTIKVTGDAVLFHAHGSGGCNAGGAGLGGGLVIGLVALLVVRRRRRRAILAAVVVLAAIGVAPAARADGIGLSVFAPMPATAGEGFALQTPEIGASGSWVANAVVSYASNPLVVDGRGSSALVSRSTLMQIGLAYALLGRLELGAHLPIYQQSGDVSSADASSTDLKPARGTATGNLALHLKARLVRVAGAPGTFALGGSAIATVPTATRGQFTGADQPEGRLLVLAAFTPAALDARLTISGNAGPVIRKESHYEDIVQKSAAAWGAGLSVRILDELWATGELFGEVPLPGEGARSSSGAMAPLATVSAIEGLAGLTIKPDHRVSIGMAVGRGVTGDIGTPDLRGVLTVSIVPGAAPLAPIHPIVPDGDADGDGIPDSVDRCPHEPEDKDGFQDADGCPDPDNDGDGIPDALDKCPNEPEDKDGFEDLDGCPDPDNDHDGIPDEKDRCPNEPETINGFQDDDGCPDKGDSTIILSPDKIETLDPIQFTGVKLAKTATPLIEQVGATLRAHPEILRVRITVHVQPTSDPDADQARTDKRAQAVRDWLVQWGVAPTRLEVRGFGGTKPLVSPDQRGAAKLNDRIEFIILERN